MIKHVAMWTLWILQKGLILVQNSKRIKIEPEALIKHSADLEYRCRINIFKDPSAYHVELNSIFKNENDLQLYKKHPGHRAFSNFVTKVIDSSVVINYEID